MKKIETSLINAIIKAGAATAMSLEQIILLEVSEWKNSLKRRKMLEGAQYYRNKSAILKRERATIGESGAKEIVGNLANNKLVNGFIRKLVDQKIGYLLAKPMSIQTDDEEYQPLLTDFFNEYMFRRIQNVGKEAIIKGISWLHVYYDENGRLSFTKIPSEEIIPLWRDDAHTELDALIRVYEVEVYEGTCRTNLTKIEWWDTNGVRRYVLNGTLMPDIEVGSVGAHFSGHDGKKEIKLNWDEIPFIAFKYNEEEQPLLELVQSLVDEYDAKKSDNSNNLEDLPNSIYVVKNYGGANGGEFRKNIATYRVVFTGDDGSVDTINLEIDTEAYKHHMEQNRKDIYEFGRGIDSQSDKFGNSPSGIALKFLYADLDMDANIIETEFKAALQQLRRFIDAHIFNTSGKDFSSQKVDFIFNRDILINETEAVDNCKKSVGVISNETIVSQHPWTSDVKLELKRIAKEKAKEQSEFDLYEEAFRNGEKLNA